MSAYERVDCVRVGDDLAWLNRFLNFWALKWQFQILNPGEFYCLSIWCVVSYSLGVQLFSYSIKVFYGSGDCLVLNIPTSDSDDIPEIVRRLEEISIGCQVKQGFLTGFLLSSMPYACILC